MPGKKIFDFDTEINFGKHKGKTPQELIEDGQASYIVWIYDNVDWCVLTDDLYDEASEAAETEDHDGYYGT
jgi:hypothetical protein